MIRASDFINPAKAQGFNTWAGVPCSFLTPFINSVIDDPDMSYVSAANEGDAVAVATGAALAGRRVQASSSVNSQPPKNRTSMRGPVVA